MPAPLRWVYDTVRESTPSRVKSVRSPEEGVVHIAQARERWRDPFPIPSANMKSTRNHRGMAAPAGSRGCSRAACLDACRFATHSDYLQFLRLAARHFTPLRHDRDIQEAPSSEPMESLGNLFGVLNHPNWPRPTPSPMVRHPKSRRITAPRKSPNRHRLR